MSLVKEYEAFVAVVENGSVKAAAKATLSTPPSVSKWITKLEARVGAKLLDRSTHAISVTGVGQEFYLRVREILEKVQQAEALVESEQSLMGGKLNLSLPSIMLRTGLPSLIQAFCNENPNVQVDLQVSDQFVDLVQQQIDFAIRVGELEDSRLTAIPLGKYVMSFYASPRYVESNPNITIKSLLDGKHIILPTSLSIAGLSKLADKSEKNTLNVREYHSANDGNALIEMGCAGMGVVQALDVTVQKEVEVGNLVRLFPNARKAKVPVYLVFRNHDYLQDYKLAFKDYVKKHYRHWL